MVLPSRSRDPRFDIKSDKDANKTNAGYNLQTRRPLKNKKIYLDVKNHSVSSKLEGNLKSLGATIEVFLVKGVHLVVTDRPDWRSAGSGSGPRSASPCPQPPAPAGTWSESPATTDSPGGELQPPKAARSRAEAMLEKALLQPKQISLDPLDNAVQWGISIWSLDKVLKWLDKVSNSKTISQASPQDSRLLEKPFIKLESSHRHCPSYKEFSAWPTISLDFEAGGCPFSVGKAAASVARPGDTHTQHADAAFKLTDGLSGTSRMTRKARSNSKLHQDVCTVGLPGYCEICQVKYCDQKTHVQSETHLRFIKDDCNFVSLDLLIKHKCGMDSFLQLNGASELTQCSMLGNPRRSLRSVLKLTSLDSQPLSQDYPPPNGQHATTASALNMRQTLEEKHLSKVAQHEEPLEILCNGMVNHNYETRHGSKVPAPIRRSFWDDRAKPRRARTTSATFCSFSEEVPTLQLSPTGSNMGHRLRSRGKPTPASTPADEEKQLWYCEVQPASPRWPADQPDQPACIGSRDLKSDETCKPCRGNSEAIRKKRPSAEEKLIEDNKAYYKLELKNSKLRSSRYFIPHKVSEVNSTKTETQCDKSNVYFSDTNGEKIGENCASVKVMEETVVKVKKKPRRSELSVLSDEAESFMFGEPLRHDGSFEFTEDLECSAAKTYDEIAAGDGEGHVGKVKKDEDSVAAVKQDGESNSRLTPLPCDESSLGSIASSCDTSSTRRKRRTHAEAFIHDNLDYYKFEIPGSRLRHQGSNSPNTSASKSVKETKPANTNEASVQVSLSPSGADVGPEETAEANSSPGGADSVKDVKEVERGVSAETCAKASSSYGPVLQELQYSFEFIPESEPWYQTYKRQDEGDEVYFPQRESVRWRTFLLPYEMSPCEVSSSSVEPCSLGEANGLKYKKKKKMRRNRYSHLLESKPRKSPRCHASTLAILSSLRHNRKRKEAEKQERAVDVHVSSPLDESSQDTSPVEASSSKNEASEPESAEPFGEIERNFEKLLTGDEDDRLSEDIQVQDCELSSPSGSGDAQTKCLPTERRRSSHPCRRKSVQGSRKLNGANSSKETTTTDLTPVTRRSCKEQSVGATCLPTPRSGLDSDVLELLESISSFGRFEKDSLANRRDFVVSKREAVLPTPELSCNSSECSMASTCDSSFFSDVLGNNSKCSMRKRKKRKKNLTGWPIERHRKKGLKKAAGVEEDDCKCGVLQRDPDSCSKAEGGGLFSDASSPSHATSISTLTDQIARIEHSQATDRAPNVHPTSAGEVTDCTARVDDRHDGPEGLAEEERLGKGAGCCEGTEHSPEDATAVAGGRPGKHGPTRTVSLETSRAGCEYQPCVRVMKMTNLADMLCYSQPGAGGRRLRSASSPSSSCAQQDAHHAPRRASPRKKAARVAAWDMLVSKRR